MLPTKQRFRWPADPRTLHTNKPLPVLNTNTTINVIGGPPGNGIIPRNPKQDPNTSIVATAVDASIVPASFYHHFQSTPRRARMASQHVIAVLDFLEQQEREVQSELARVAREVRALRRVVRAVRRDHRKRGGGSVGAEYLGSGSDADTEEVSVVVIEAD